jgi:hypothetical protein
MTIDQRKHIMTKEFLYCAVALVLAMCGATAPATAQFPPPPPLPTPLAEAQPVPVPPKGKKAPAPPGLSIAGNWSGQVTQVGSQAPYKFELVIGPKGAETKYPDLDCTGTLTRAGAWKSYIFFVEIITKGAVDKGTVPTVRSRLRERVTIWRCSGLAVSKTTRSSLTARSRKSSMQSDAIASHEGSAALDGGSETLCYLLDRNHI